MNGKYDRVLRVAETEAPFDSGGAETVAGTLFDWGRQKGYTPEELNRAAQMQGIGPVVNEFAEGMNNRAPAAAQPPAGYEFRPVTPEEFIVQRNKSTRLQLLTPYPVGEMAGWKIWMTEDGAGYAIKPDGDLVNVFNVSGRSGAGVEAVIDAIQNSATKLDCFDGHLVDIK